MLRHIVLFKIKDEYKSEIPELVKAFYDMNGKIDGLISAEAGQDFLGSDRSYDLGLCMVFRDRAAFEGYQTHPVHVPVRKKMHEVRSGSVSCDYELPE